MSWPGSGRRLSEGVINQIGADPGQPLRVGLNLGETTGNLCRRVWKNFFSSTSIFIGPGPWSE